MNCIHCGARFGSSPLLLPVFQAVLARAHVPALIASPVFWGIGIPHGDGSAVVVIPGLLASDCDDSLVRTWLARIGYRASPSGIALNAECPNILIRTLLRDTVAQAYRSTGRRVHLIGHSLGGLLALGLAALMPGHVRSVITLGTPLNGRTPQPLVAGAASLVRAHILDRHRGRVFPGCFTHDCDCWFGRALRRRPPREVRLTAIYTKTDGVVDWRDCRTGDCSVDCEVPLTTHSGLIRSPAAFEIIAARLASVAY